MLFQVPTYLSGQNFSLNLFLPAQLQQSCPEQLLKRIKYISFIVFSFLLTMFVYPIVGHWIWGGGFLQKMGMLDFSGGAVVPPLADGQL